jgi:hypothetical protein
MGSVPSALELEAELKTLDRLLPELTLAALDATDWLLKEERGGCDDGAMEPCEEKLPI